MSQDSNFNQSQPELWARTLAEKDKIISELEEKISLLQQAMEEQRVRLIGLAEQERIKLEDAFCEVINKLETELQEKNAYIDNLEKENRDRVPDPIPLAYKKSLRDDDFDELDLKDPVNYESTSRSYARPSLAHVVGERQRRKMSVKDLANAWSNRR